MHQQFHLDLPKSRNEKEAEEDRKVQRMRKIMQDPTEIAAIDAIKLINHSITIEDSEMMPTEILAALDGKRVILPPKQARKMENIYENGRLSKINDFNREYPMLEAKRRKGMNLTTQEMHKIITMKNYFYPEYNIGGMIKEIVNADYRKRVLG